MRIMTKAFGEVEVSEKQRVYFETGIFGFDDIHDYVLIDTEKGSPFYLLQAEKIPETAFILIDPLLVDNKYILDVDPDDIKELDLTNNENEILIFSIVTIYSNPNDITVNLLGPIVINKNNHKAKQVINQKDYNVKTPLISKKGAEC